MIATPLRRPNATLILLFLVLAAAPARGDRPARTADPVPARAQDIPPARAQDPVPARAQDPAPSESLPPAAEPAPAAPEPPPAAPEPPPAPQADGTRVLPIPILFYSPETRLGGGASALVVKRLGRGAARATRPSAFSGVAIYTANKQLVASINANLQLPGDRDGLSLEVGFTRFPSRFYGVGNDAPDRYEEFTPRDLAAFAQGERRFGRGLKLGLSADFSRHALVAADSGGVLDAGAVPGTGRVSLAGAGAILAWDTRDGVFAPRRGAYLLASASAFLSGPGSDLGYRRYVADARVYLPEGRGFLLAARATGAFTSGRAPFYRMPTLGGASLLRGYYEGRFRDRQLAAVQVEERAHLFWRLGAAAFAEAGQVAPAIGDLGLGRFHTAAGWGLRYTLDRRENLAVRVDFGYGSEGSGLYLNFGEAF